eukprot:gene5967-6206_t
MAYEEYIKRAVHSGRRYEDLPDKVKAILPLQEWRAKVKEVCIQQGVSWAGSLAKTVCNEQDYYEDLIKTYKGWTRLYPYHLADYIARVLRITPFKYYSDVLFLTLKDEKSYDRIPNFTAADALRELGIGRNEYIDIMNACKAKRLMWRVNKGLAKDLLPSAARDIRMEGWWLVCVVNVGDAEFRELSAAEAGLLRAACDSPQPTVSAFDPALLQQLYKKGIIYLDIPIAADDRLTLPPLEGFVSNKTAEAGDDSVDPLEPLLYSLFLANSSRLDQAQLSEILGVSREQLHLATSLAVRLGFASKLGVGGSPGDDGLAGALASTRSAGSLEAMSSQATLAIPDNIEESTFAANRAPAGTGVGVSPPAAANLVAEGSWGAAGGAGEGGAVAVVVDAEATGYLMMGALSPGLKRHSVTLFEGGRVAGAEVMEELVEELAASAAAAQQFEGDMVLLMRHIQSLGVLLSTVRSAAAAQNQQVELLRRESLAGLDPQSAAKVLCHAYTAMIPIAPLPGPSLPLTPFSPAAPAYYGPTPEANSPWLSLALYAAARSGPVSLVFVAGQRVWRLPHQLEGCTHALLWGWKVGAASGAAAEPQPLLVEGTTLLCTLNELLCRTAVMVQPLVYLQQLPDTAALASASPMVAFVDVPLPLCPAAEECPEKQEQGPEVEPSGAGAEATSEHNHAAGHTNQVTAASAAWQTLHSLPTSPRHQQQLLRETGEGMTVTAVDKQQDGKLERVTVPVAVVAALAQLQLDGAVGWVRLVRLPAAPSSSSSVGGVSAASVHLGAPLFCPTLCQAVCRNMTSRKCLTAAGRAAWCTAQLMLQQQLWQLVGQYGALGAQHIGLSAREESLKTPSAVRPCSPGEVGGHVQVPAGLEEIVVSGEAELPACVLLFDGSSLLAVDAGDCLQGVRLW